MRQEYLVSGLMCGVIITLSSWGFAHSEQPVQPEVTLPASRASAVVETTAQPTTTSTTTSPSTTTTTLTPLPRNLPDRVVYHQTTTTTTPKAKPKQVQEYLGEGAVEPRYDLLPLPGIEKARCGDWWQTAVEVGWPVERLATLDDIMWDESNCLPHVISPTNDFGLVQINWHAHGSRLTEQGITQDYLLNAKVNLEQGLWIANYAEKHYGCWAQPWKYSGSRC